MLSSDLSEASIACANCWSNFPNYSSCVGGGSSHGAYRAHKRWWACLAGGVANGVIGGHSGGGGGNSPQSHIHSQI